MPRGRRTYGHSLIVDPWGEVLADAGEGVGIVTARIDPAAIAKARRMVRRYSTTGRLQSRSLPPALSRPNSIELGVFVNIIEAYLDANRGKFEDGAAFDDLIDPFCPGACIKIHTARVLFN